MGLPDKPDHRVKRLVWFETHDGIEAAIRREKRLKKYKREWKINLIEQDNPDWDDLFPQFFLADGPPSALQPREPPMCAATFSPKLKRRLSVSAYDGRMGREMRRRRRRKCRPFLP